jgi:hypothetical protein
MMKFVFAFATLTLAVASAANRYTVQISEKSEINGQVLKPGEYQLEMKDNHAILKNGKTVVEAEARVETQDKKFAETTVRYTSGEPNAKIDEIRLSGTTTKIVFSKAQASGN